ncbi:hypothetical protein CIY_25820 [Butyrivibrio fibrisolvens 16/4]|nr:hypothetical protein CIY_25820 [Butyrivibrio fibrisolvens 16/4]
MNVIVYDFPERENDVFAEGIIKKQEKSGKFVVFKKAKTKCCLSGNCF